MELKTFSAVLRFTLELEDRSLRFYAQASLSEKCAPAKDVFITFAQSSRKRRLSIEKTARESVDHSLLEPISGLLEENYAVPTAYSDAMTYADVLSGARQLEELMQRFYSEAAEKIKFIPVVSKLYKRCAQERTRALTALQDVI